MVLLLELFSVTNGQLVAAIMPTSYAAEMLNPFLLVIFTAFSLVTVQRDQLPDALGVWLVPLNP